jgi:hypothetical protein
MSVSISAVELASSPVSLVEALLPSDVSVPVLADVPLVPLVALLLIGTAVEPPPPPPPPHAESATATEREYITLRIFKLIWDHRFHLEDVRNNKGRKIALYFIGNNYHF